MDPSLNTVLAGREQEKWIGQTLVLKGTVSRVEVERDGDPKWVHIYFKESPDAIITGCSPFPDMLMQEVRQRPLDSGRQDHRNDWTGRKILQAQYQRSHCGSGADQAGELAF